MTTSRLDVWLSRAAAGVRRWTVCPLLPCLAATLWMSFTPGLASGQSGGVQGSAASVIQGMVKDASGSAVPGAIVTLEDSASTGQRTAIADPTGAFHFFKLERGNY